MNRAFELKKVDGIEVHSVFEKTLESHGTVNVAPESREAAMQALEERGYEIGVIEELRDVEDGERFTRINFFDPSK